MNNSEFNPNHINDIDKISPKRLAVAPMMDWTDRHCRSFHRLLSKDAILYTEMVTTGALLLGDAPRHLDYEAPQHPLVLQLGGSEPTELAQAAKLAQQWGYDEIDLNCGCPSERVQKGSFGACLMAEPKLVADCVKAMKDVVDIPVSVKHRLGLNDMNPEDNPTDYQFVLDFMCEVANVGASQVTIHARNAVLKGLTPKENRVVPPLRYGLAKRLRLDAKKHFPSLKVLLNGGLENNGDIARYWNDFDGFMLGRSAYHQPAILLGWDQMLQTHGQEYGYFLGEKIWLEIQEGIIEFTIAWLHECKKQNMPFHIAAITRHILGFAHGLGGSRYWRQMLSDHRILSDVRDEGQIREFYETAAKRLRIFSEFNDEDLALE